MSLGHLCRLDFDKGITLLLLPLAPPPVFFLGASARAAGRRTGVGGAAIPLCDSDDLNTRDG